MSIVRITAVVEVNFEDVTFADYKAQTWTVVEVSVAAIVACLPLCRWVIDLVLPRNLLSSTTRSNRSNQKSKSNNTSQLQTKGREPWHPTHTPDSYRTLDEEDDTIELTARGKTNFTTSTSEFAERDSSDLEAARLGNIAAATRGPVTSQSPATGIAVERKTTVTYG
jgi:hypothetical protein